MKSFRMAVFFSAAALVPFACAGVRPVVPVARAAAPVPVVAVNPVPSSDYFTEGCILAGNRSFDWQGDLYRVPFYTAKVLTAASAATKGETEVQATGKVEGSASGRFWTPYIAASRPAKKEDLKAGVLVFAMGDAAPRSRDELSLATVWSLFRVKDVSNLYKGTVVLEYNDTYWNAWKSGEYHVDNIRLVLGDFSPELRK